ncbi:MAG: AEC family transporter, partial [Clostridia bacterium]|nr:AEC family transporter [Clostridia bacterium]
LIFAGIAVVLALALEKDNAKRGAMAQGMFRSNFVIFGLPVATSLFGDEAAAKASILIAVAVPMFNVLAVVVLTIFGSGTFNVKKIVKGVVTNPLIIASVIGLIFLATGITLPSQVHTVVKDLGKIATPLAFILLGASFHFDEVHQYLKHLTVSLSMRLVFFPLLTMAAAILLGFRNAELAILLTMSGAPVAVSSYTMAQQMGSDDKLAGQLVVLSSVLCIITMFLWIFTLKQFAFM